MLLKILAEEEAEERARAAEAKKSPTKRVRKMLKPGDGLDALLKATNKSALANPLDAVSAALAAAASALATSHHQAALSKPAAGSLAARKAPLQLAQRAKRASTEQDTPQPSQRGAPSQRGGASFKGAKSTAGKPTVVASKAGAQTVIATAVSVGGVPRTIRPFLEKSEDGGGTAMDATVVEDAVATEKRKEQELSRRNLGKSLDNTIRRRRANNLPLAKPLERAYTRYAGTRKADIKKVGIELCALLEQLLRHTARAEQVPISPEGWVSTIDVLDYLDTLGRSHSMGEVWGALTDNGGWHFEISAYGEHVRATHGHTVEGVAVVVGKLLTLATAPPVAVTGLQLDLLQTTLKEGISRRNTRHIHLSRSWIVEAEAKKGESRRNRAEILVWVNVHRAISAGIHFYLTAKGDILCDGTGGEGLLPPTYFSVVLELQDGLSLDAAQARLLERLFSGCPRLAVRRLQRGAAGSLVLRTDSYDGDGNREEPTVTKLGPAPTILAEMKKANLLSSLSAGVMRVSRGPLCVDGQGMEKDDSLCILQHADPLLDGPLFEQLELGSVLLLRCSWLTSFAADAALEKDPESGAPLMMRREGLPNEAFFAPMEAAALLRRGDRSVLVLSHCWQTAAHPDPHGRTFRAVRRYLRGSAATTGECGLFIDICSLPPKEHGTFQDALAVMVPLYASVAGTTVIQVKNVPPRPAQYDGLVEIHELPDSVTVASLTDDLSQIGEVIECRATVGQALVRFATHEMAQSALEELSKRDTAVSWPYNSLPYSDRGWTTFEEGVSTIMAALLAAAERRTKLPPKFATAQRCRAKVVDISTDDVREHVPTLTDPSWLLSRTATIVDTATFATAGDKAVVQALLQGFSILVSGVDSNLVATEDGSVTEDEFAGAVLEMTDACWSLPSFRTSLGSMELVGTFKEHLACALRPPAEPSRKERETREAREARDSNEGSFRRMDAGTTAPAPISTFDGASVLRDLWGPGGPLTSMMLKTVSRASVEVSSPHGLANAWYESIVAATVIAFLPPDSQIGKAAGYEPPAVLAACLDEIAQDPRFSDIPKRAAFANSFVIKCHSQTWGGDACGELTQLIRELERLVASREGSWTREHMPLQAHQHGSLGLSNVMVDLSGSLWLMNFGHSEKSSMFTDAASILSSLLLESYPLPLAMDDAKFGSVKLVMDALGINHATAMEVKKVAHKCSTRADFLRAANKNGAVKPLLSCFVDEEAAETRLREAFNVVDFFFSPALEELPDGWSEVIDSASGKAYFVGPTNETAWERPPPPLPQLWHMAARTPPPEWPAQTRSLFELCTLTLKQALALVAKCSCREQGGNRPCLPADVHPAHFLVPLMVRSLCALRYTDLSQRKKRLAFHCVQTLAKVLRGVLRQAPATPPQLTVSSLTAPLFLAPGQPVLLLDKNRETLGGGQLFVVTNDQESKAARLSAETAADFEFDGISQQALPWKQPTSIGPWSMSSLVGIAMSATAFLSFLQTLSPPSDEQVDTSSAGSQWLLAAADHVLQQLRQFEDSLTPGEPYVSLSLRTASALELLLSNESFPATMAPAEAAPESTVNVDAPTEAASVDGTATGEAQPSVQTPEVVASLRTSRVVRRESPLAALEKVRNELRRSCEMIEEAKRSVVRARRDALAQVVSDTCTTIADLVQKNAPVLAFEVKPQLEALKDMMPAEGATVAHIESAADNIAPKLLEIMRPLGFKSWFKNATSAGGHLENSVVALRSRGVPAEAAAVVRKAITQAVFADRSEDAARLESWLVDQLNGAGCTGARTYRAGQMLFVLVGGVWCDATVKVGYDYRIAHRLLVDGMDTEVEVSLNPWNHAVRQLPCSEFEILRQRYLRVLGRQHATIVDPLSGRRLDVRALCAPISLMEELPGGVIEATDVNALIDWMQRMHATRSQGNADTPACVLVTAPPAAGKTCLMSQIVSYSTDIQGSLVPILVKVQELLRFMLITEHNSAFSSSWNWVDAYMQCVHGASSEMYLMLRQAMMSRRALILVDGLDEGGQLRTEIEQHVTCVLAPQGHAMVVTTRPTGLPEESFSVHFHRLQLRPLSDAQQRQVIMQRLGDDARTAQLVQYVQVLPPDSETGERITGNPLLLSMVVSIFENAGSGVNALMPATIIELYAKVSQAMLERADCKQRGIAATASTDVAGAELLRELLQATFYEAHTCERRVIEEEHLDTAALAVAAPNKLREILAADHDPKKQLAALRGALDFLPNGVRSAMRCIREQLPLLIQLQADPMQIQSAHLSFQEFYTVKAICSGLRLPPQSVKPWRWPAWWANTLHLGSELGIEFARGLNAASIKNHETLTLRSLVGGHRATAFLAVGVLTRTVTSLDLRDNRIVNSEAALLADGLSKTMSLSALNLAGNRLTVEGIRVVGAALVTSETNKLGKRRALRDRSVPDVDFSRNLVQNFGGDMADLTRVLLGNESLTTIGLNRVLSSDDVGSAFAGAFARHKTKAWSMMKAATSLIGAGIRMRAEAAAEGVEPAPAPAAATAAAPAAATCVSDSFTPATQQLEVLTHGALREMHLSGNCLGEMFAGRLSIVTAACPLLEVLDLSSNQFSADDGKALGSALQHATYLKTLDLSSNRLCQRTSSKAGADASGDWSVEAIQALMSALLGSSTSVREHKDKAEEVSSALTSISLHSNGLCGQWAEFIHGEKLLRGTYTAAAVDVLVAAVEGTSRKLALTSQGILIETGNFVRDADQKRLRLALEANAAPHADHSSGTSPDHAPAARNVSPSGSRASAANVVEIQPDLTSAEHSASIEAMLQEAKELGSRPSDVSLLSAIVEKREATSPTSPTSPGAAPRKGRRNSLLGVKAMAVGKMARLSSGDGAKDDGTDFLDALNADIAAEEEAEAARNTKSTSDKRLAATILEVDGVVPTVLEVFQGSPMMVVMQNVVARVEPRLGAPSIGLNPAVQTGSLVRVGQTEALKDGKVMKLIQLDGDDGALGWISGEENNQQMLQPTTMGCPLMRVLKKIVVKEREDDRSKKVAGLSSGLLVRQLERTVNPTDGTEKALLANDSIVSEVIGWAFVTNREMGFSTLEQVAPFKPSFNMRVHTSTYLRSALDRLLEPKIKAAKASTAAPLPSQLAGRRPPPRSDDTTPSRHKLVTEPAELRLMFNCFNAAFEVLSWSGADAGVPFEKLPGELSFDLVSPKSKKRLGRVALAKDIGSPFLERVEFPDEWLLAKEHGLTHDGWQGDGTIDLELTWNSHVCKMRVIPWMSYGCSVGARFLVRKLQAAGGQCATVQRILIDDRIVARIDGFSKTGGVKGEIILDLQPSTIVRTTVTGYPRNTKLLLLHDGKLVDAMVLHWMGSTDYKEGSRHMVNVKPPGAATGTQAFHDLNTYNHLTVPEEMNAALYEEARSRYCQHLIETEDKVEDAITGNWLKIEDQLIFMEAMNVPNGCNPPQYMTVPDVPALVKLLVEQSPKRQHGTHLAQPVLCRAGPGTGKTWMLKQSVFLLATALNGDTGGHGIRLVPIIVFVQRIVSMLRELGADPSALLADPGGMMRWYINNAFADRSEVRTLLLHAYEMRALVILVDGVDEAAGLREIIESFVHFELVVSGNRMAVTSRPEGIDLEEYKTRFCVMNLLKLSESQQRNVINMQLAGNAFFEHLVNIAECRRDLDAKYHEIFRTEGLRAEVEAISFTDEVAPTGTSDPKAVAAAESKADGKEAGTSKKVNAKDETGSKKKSESKAIEVVIDEKDEATRRAEAMSVLAEIKLARRRLILDNQQDMQAWLEQHDLSEIVLRSAFLRGLNAAVLLSTDAYSSLLSQLDHDIKALPSPCTRAQIEPSIITLERHQPGGRLDTPLHEAVVQLALQRKQPLPGGRRDANVSAMPTAGLWHQCLQHTDDRFAAAERLVPALNYLLGDAATTAGIPSLSLRVDEGSGQSIPGTARARPELTFRDPVTVWLNSTYATAAEPTERPPVPWCTMARMRCETAEQVVQLCKRLQRSIALTFDGMPATLTMIDLKNTFTPDCHHPTHHRSAMFQMLLSFNEEYSVLLVQVEHVDLLQQYHAKAVSTHYEFFLHRIMGMSDLAFDLRFERLLIFLVEAIGVPVLLSLLLLTFSNTKNSDVIDLDELPEGRMQLYKFGIMSGIRKRMQVAATQMAAASAAKAPTTERGALAGPPASANGPGGSSTPRKAGATEAKKKVVEEVPAEAAAAGGKRPRKEKRKGALEQNSSSLSATGPGGNAQADAQMQQSAAERSKQLTTNEPVLDLNPILRGKKVRIVVGENEVAEGYSLVMRVLNKSLQPGFDLRSGVTTVVPKSHSMHAPVAALVEHVLAPMSLGEEALLELGKKMLRRVAVSNQENGRREFTSRNVACALGANPEELGLWSRFDMDEVYGVPLAATLAKQSDKAPAQYQFKHLSFQEGLYAEHLLLLVTSLQPPGPGWVGWSSDSHAAEFLNNRFMNNTCRIAAGHLGSLLARQRADWDFRRHPLTGNGRMALWYITEENVTVASISVANNEVSSQDVGGLAKMIATCPSLLSLDLSNNDLRKLTTVPSEWSKICTSLSTNSTLTELNLSRNKLGPVGTRIVAKSLLGCTGLRRLGFSYNEPGVEPTLAELFRHHPALESVELVEAIDRHLPSRTKDEIGHALLANKSKTLGFLHCDTFVLSEETRSLVWPKEASMSDAVLLAGALVTNTVLTSFNIAAGASLSNAARAALGEALLHNKGSRLAFCNDFGLLPNVDKCEFDLSRVELKDVEPFSLLAGCLRGNRTLTHVTLRQLRMEQIETLALALRGNNTLDQLDLIHTTRMHGQSMVRLPVPDLNGSRKHASREVQKRVDMSKTCLEGNLGRVACAMIGTLIASNTALECLDLSNTGLGIAIAVEAEGGHILLRPLCESQVCPLSELNLSNIQLNDKAGSKLLTALSSGQGEGGYEKITSLSLASNDLGKLSAAALKQLLWGERAPCMIKSLDISNNQELEGSDLVVAIKRNDSLTSIDFANTPSANFEEIYASIGTFLLQKDCMCRLALLSCDAFKVVAGQGELVLKPPSESEMQERGDRSRGNRGLMSLLAGVFRFNSSIRKLQLSNTGLDSDSLAFFTTALKENSSLEELDVSGNDITAEGIQKLAEAAFGHPTLVSVKIDGTALPVAQLRGIKGSENTLDVGSWSLGPLSGVFIGTLARNNRSMHSLNLKANNFGASGVSAIVSGLSAAPLKALDLTGNKLGVDKSDVKDLCGSLCRNMGLLAELRMDENELDCSPSALAPLCKLRGLRTLSLDKNRLTSIPGLLGTMTSLRRILLHSNHLVELPASICLLTNLETLDVHKNQVRALPAKIGALKSLHKLDLSENKITELPVSICELSEEMQFLVGRNPLEKPSVEQARQGIGAIRRYFGVKPSKGGTDDVSDLAAENVVLKPKEGPGETETVGTQQPTKVKRPAKEKSAPSRHDWAGPGGVVLLFNCFGCSYDEVEGGHDLASIPDDEEADIVAAFNLQSIGKVCLAKGSARSLAERIELSNEWLPWHIQEVAHDDVAKLIVHVKWSIQGGAIKQSASLLFTPFLSFGCSLGSRLKSASGLYSTVVRIHHDDTCDVLEDNAKDTRPVSVDPRPDTVSRTSSPSYKPGQKLLLLLEGSTPSDAVVDEWLGIHQGSRHRLRTGGKANRATVDIDLNETNHAKLLFPSLGRYEDARARYCAEVTIGKHSVVRDEATTKDLSVTEQRIFLRPVAAAGESAGPMPLTWTSRYVRASSEPADEPTPFAVTSLFEKIVEAAPVHTTVHPPTLIRASSRAESAMLLNQAMVSLANLSLRPQDPSLGPIRLAPVAISLQRMGEQQQDEQAFKQGARGRISKVFEADYPEQADVLKQAMDLKALLVVVEVRDESELGVLSESMLQELQANRLILIVSPRANGALAECPVSLVERCVNLQVSSLSLSFSAHKVSNRFVGNLFKRIRTSTNEMPPSHYSSVTRLHLSSSDLGGEAAHELQELLVSDDCSLLSLDLSSSGMDGWPLVQALRSNHSLTCLDVRSSPAIKSAYEAIAGVLLNPSSVSRLAYFRCDAFDLLEGVTSFSLRETAVEPAAGLLLAGLLRRNNHVQELDLTATDLESSCVIALASTLEVNTTLTTLRLMYNPAVDEKSKATLTTAAERYTPLLHLEM